METRLFCMVPGTGFNGGKIGCYFGGDCNRQRCPRPINYVRWDELQVNPDSEPSQEFVNGVWQDLEEFEREALAHVCRG